MIVRLILICCTCTLALGWASASAAVGPECGFFEYQDQAQEALDKVAADFPTLLEMHHAPLDPDLVGVACPELPTLPALLSSSHDIRGGFDEGAESVVLEGAGYSARYDVVLAGVSFDVRGSSRGDLLTPDNLDASVNQTDTLGSIYYIATADGTQLPPDANDDRYQMTGIAWTVAGDPQSPVLVNEWLLSQGLGVIDDRTVPADMEGRFRDAESTARANGLGVWGTCSIPVSLKDSSPTAAGAYDHLFRQSGEGDQVTHL